MRYFPEAQGENCILELLKCWISYTSDLEISSAALFMCCGKLGFHYESTMDNPTLVFPIVKLKQDYVFDGLRDMVGIAIEGRESTADTAWSDIEPLLLRGEVPVVNGLSSLFTTKIQGPTTVTYLAVHNYNQEQRTVDVASILFNGQMTVEKLHTVREKTQDFGIEPFNWLEFRWLREPQTLPIEAVMKRMYANFIEDDIAVKSPENIRRFATDLAMLEKVTPVMKGLLLKNLTVHMYHPWAPVATSQMSAEIMEELAASGYVSKETVNQFQALHEEWRTVQMLFVKSTMADPNKLLPKMIAKLNQIADMEYTALTNLDKELKVV